MKKTIAMIGALVILSTVIALVAFPLGASAASAGGTGLTAAVVATSGQKISGTIDATGYDIGIYIGPGVHNVKVIGATISGANDEGILVQDASNILIENSMVSYNGVNPTPGITENKAIMLVGTKNCLVKDNIVEYNMGDGGIGVMDDGPVINPGAPVATATSPMAGTGNIITDNLIQDNAFGCGIVVAAFTPGAGVVNNIVSKNTLIGGWSGTPGDSIPYVGGIVVAADAPSTMAMNNIVLNNVVNDSLIPGLVVHSNAPGDVVSGTKLIGNVLSNDGALAEGPNTPYLGTGIAIIAEVSDGEPNPPALTDTQLLSDTVSNDYYGVWVMNATSTHIAPLQTSAVTTPVFTGP
jgi:hypothetical protein